jgi:tRNA pseudouridine55 synthase
VTVHRLDLAEVASDRVTVRIECSSGFYVRSLAHDLGERLGVGGHVTALRRTRCGDYTLAEALPLETAERDPASAACQLLPLSRILLRFPAVTLTPAGIRRARQGQCLRPADLLSERPPEPRAPEVRLVDPAGNLVGIARPAAQPGLLHPFVVLM